MPSLHRESPAFKSGLDRAAPKPIDPYQLAGSDRFAWERRILEQAAAKGLGGSRLHILRVLFDFCRGKPECWPSNARIAKEAGLSVRTVQRVLQDLAAAGIIRIEAGEQRRIVLVDHPATASSPPCQPVTAPASACHGGDDSVSPKAVERSKPEVESNPIPTPVMNEPTNSKPEAEPTPEVPFTDWRSLAASLAKPVEAETAPPPAPRHRIGLDRSAAPIDDPVVAAELANRCEKGFRNNTKTLSGPTKEQILDAVLGRAGTQPEPRPEPLEPREVQSIQPEPDGPKTAPGVAPNAMGQVLEQETIRALSAIGPGATAKEVTIATLRLASLFGDHKSLRFYRGVINDVARGDLPARVPIAAVENARRPGVIKPAAVFTGYVERCRRTWSERRRQ